MGSTAQARASFIDALLAPLPAGETPAADKAFLRQLRADHEDIWLLRWQKYLAMEGFWSANNLLRIRAAKLDPQAQDLWSKQVDECMNAMVRAIDDLMRTPAPHVRGLRWKQTTRKFNGGRSAWEVAIAADELRLNIGKAR